MERRASRSEGYALHMDAKRAIEANRMLDNMRVSINKHYREIMDRDDYVTAEKVKNAFLGRERHVLMLLPL